MIDFIKAKEEFLKYTSKFPKDDGPIQMKIHHSLRVTELSEKIAMSLNLSNEEIELAKLIGLLHDIGRFEQRKIFSTFLDEKSFDHGNFGEAILRKNDYIRTFIEDDRYDETIFKAIRNHNKYAIEKGLTEKEILFAKIIRDADKLDILYQSTEILFKKYECMEVNEEIDKNVIEMLYSKQLINSKAVNFTKLTNIIFRTFALIYDINFNYTFKKILEEDYLKKIEERFDFKNKEVKVELQKIVGFCNEYIKERLQK